MLTAKEELAAFWEGDTLILKRINGPVLSTIAERNPEEEMPLDEICEEVHFYREEKRASESNV